MNKAYEMFYELFDENAEKYHLAMKVLDNGRSCSIIVRGKVNDKKEDVLSVNMTKRFPAFLRAWRELKMWVNEKESQLSEKEGDSK